MNYKTFVKMPKRFTDTEKWKKPFIRNLSAPYKLLWLYICDDCDHSGIWQVDIDVAKIRIGEDINEQDAIKFFDDKIIKIDNGNKWFIPSFIDFQYPSGLNPDNKAHGGIIKMLLKYKLIDDQFKPLISPLQGDKVMVMDKVKDKDKVKEEIELPFVSDFFAEIWNAWKDYKKKEFKFTYKTKQSELAALNELIKISKGHEDQAIKILNQSMANGWKGLFNLKEDAKGTTNNQRKLNKHELDNLTNYNYVHSTSYGEGDYDRIFGREDAESKLYHI